MARKMKRANKAKAKAAQRVRSRRISRPLIAQFLTDLCDRLEKQVWIAQALAKASAPTAATMMGAWPMLKVIELAATAHLDDLRQATEFAKLINDKVAP